MGEKQISTQGGVTEPSSQRGLAGLKMIGTEMHCASGDWSWYDVQKAEAVSLNERCQQQYAEDAYCLPFRAIDGQMDGRTHTGDGRMRMQPGYALLF